MGLGVFCAELEFVFLHKPDLELDVGLNNMTKIDHNRPNGLPKLLGAKIIDKQTNRQLDIIVVKIFYH